MHGPVHTGAFLELHIVTRSLGSPLQASVGILLDISRESRGPGFFFPLFSFSPFRVLIGTGDSVLRFFFLSSDGAASPRSLFGVCTCVPWRSASVRKRVGTACSSAPVLTAARCYAVLCVFAPWRYIVLRSNTACWFAFTGHNYLPVILLVHPPGKVSAATTLQLCKRRIEHGKTSFANSCKKQ